MNHKLSAIALAVLSATSLSFSALVHAEEAKQKKEEIEVIEVTGIRTALGSALAEKRSALNVKEIIQAEDIGKLPDNNLAEVLENISGVQISRSQGVGTNVQIRGTGANRVEINGVSTVNATGGRTGINFSDLPAALISSVEVTKSPTAKTIEGSVGGTINLRTIRANNLDDTLLQFRAQAESSDLADSTTPRFSGTFGDNWETDYGKVGVVLTGSYAEQDVASINPRFDRDAGVHPDADRDFPSEEEFSYLPIQFLKSPFNQKQYTTTNFTGSFEFEPTDNLKFYVDATVNDQEVLQSTSVLHGSGVSNSEVRENADNFTFETRDFGTLDSINGPLHLGEMTVVTSGILPASSGAKLDPNLRMETATSPRLTKSNVFAFGTEWVGEKLRVAGEVSYSDSEQSSPTTQGQLDFINPRSAQPSADTSTDDNGTPLEFNSSGGFMEWGIAQGLATTPTTAELLDPANYALDKFEQKNTNSKGEESAARLDFSYDVSDDLPYFTDIHAGVRWNEASSTRNYVKATKYIKGWDRPRADLFADIVTTGPSNFDGADGRTLFIPDFLMLDPQLAQNNPQKLVDSINTAIILNNAATGNSMSLISEPSDQATSFFDISEESTALYLQGDFETEFGDIVVAGNAGVRYITTDISSTGNQKIDGEIETSNQKSSYSFTLPRLNVMAELTDDLVVRVGMGKDVRRPSFSDLSTSTSFGDSPTQVVKVGNPDLEPETVMSYDLSFEYYFAESSLASIGFFRKERTDIIATSVSQPAEFTSPEGFQQRYVDGDCSGGGIHNPSVPVHAYDIFSNRTDTGGGMCVPREAKENNDETETQQGIELAFQYDLSGFEEELGWASGFGVIANYTYQKASEKSTIFRTGKSGYQKAFQRTDGAGGVYTTATLDDDYLTQRAILDNLSENAYNLTAYYDKHDLSVRVRYTWRDAYTNSNTNLIGGLAPVFEARGQLNLSVGYDISDAVSVGLSAVNLTQEDATRWCLNDGALLCEQNTSDRRITAGVTIKM